MKVLTWLMHGTDKDIKHQQWKHPLVCGIIANIIVNGVVYIVCEHYLKVWGLPRNLDSWTRSYMAPFLIAYILILIIGRCIVMGNWALYDLLWTCNVIIISTIMGLLVNNQLIVCASYLTILVDQMQWFVDVISYILTRKFAIGVIEYLKRKETHMFKKLTCSHHLWFVPLCFYMTIVLI